MSAWMLVVDRSKSHSRFSSFFLVLLLYIAGHTTTVAGDRLSCGLLDLYCKFTAVCASKRKLKIHEIRLFAVHA